MYCIGLMMWHLSSFYYLYFDIMIFIHMYLPSGECFVMSIYLYVHNRLYQHFEKFPCIESVAGAKENSVRQHQSL